jgi:prepilin-type N-terminal cleavage/methylation domain-containing protein
MTKRASKSTRAFSLIEVMIALLILGVALVGFVQGTTTALSSSKESEIQTTAVLLASGRVEQLRADGELEDGDTEGDWGDDFPNYSWRQTVAPTEIKGLHDITLTIENPKTGKQVYALRTMLFEPPLVQEDEDTSKTSKSKKKQRKGAEE